jgi:hypothetical protein
MGQRTLGGDDLTLLRERYLQRVTEALPEAAAEAGDWPIYHDHCFARVVLDTLFQGVWYDYIDETPAYEQLSTEELREAIKIGDKMLEDGKPTVEALNQQSLEWRDH